MPLRTNNISGGTDASKICNKRDSAATLGHSPKLCIEYTPCNGPPISHDASALCPLIARRSRYNGIPLGNCGERLEHRPEILAFVGAKGSGYVFPNSVSWIYSIGFIPHLSYYSDGLHKQDAPLSVQPLTVAGHA